MATFSQPFADWARAQASDRTREIAVDAVVIGSGYGGAVAALRLAEEGRSVLVLERGAEFQPGDFPNHLGQLPKFVRAHGLQGTVGSLGGVLDFRIGQGMAALVGNGLGGGSLVNAGVMMRPDADVFAQPAWPAEIRHGLDERRSTPGGDPLGLDGAFQRAAARLGPEVYQDPQPPGAPGPVPPPVSQLPKAQALRRMGEVLRTKLGSAFSGQPDNALDYEAKPARVTIALDKCVRCGDCFTGCNVPGAKKTLLTNYLGEARDLGATLLTGALVYALRPARGPQGQQEWRLDVLPTENERNALKLKDSVACEGYRLRAALVVVAAGTFGSTELLQRSHELDPDFDLSPALGSRLSGNGDSLSVLADLQECVDGVGTGADHPAAPVGPTITTVLDLRQRREIDQRVVIQEGAVPGALGRIHAELLATTWTLRHLGTFGRRPRANKGLEALAASMNLARHTQLLLAMGHDGSRGRVVWLAAMDGAVPYWVAPDEDPAYRRQQQLFDAAESGGGVHLHPPTWRFVRPALAQAADGMLPPPTLLSVHPLGGCPMGDRYETGVVNHRGEVWRGPSQLWGNLYVLDGSIVPTSLGCNPLWTITALAERAMAHRRLAVVARPGRGVPAGAAARAPKATARQASPAIDMELLERLELPNLAVRGALRRALGADTVESDISLSMRSPDWFALWEERRHRVEQVKGTLRLVVPPGNGAGVAAAAPSAPFRKLEYTVDSGHVDLFKPEFTPLRWLLRLLRLIRVGLTWWLLRGLRDLVEPRRPRPEPFAWRALLALGWTATEVRLVRYDLRLRRVPGPCAEHAPQRLRLTGSKVVSYAATWPELAYHLWLRLTRPQTRPPGALRASLLQQLTQPRIRLATWWQRPLPGRLSAAASRFHFDQQQALQRAPARVYGGGDSTTAGLAALAYPSFVVRYLLQSRLLDFRLPTYSDRPLPDAASADDVALRIGPPGAQVRVQPQEFVLEVPMGLSSSDDGTEPPRGTRLRLRLWRYARRDAQGRPVPPTCEAGTWCGLPVRRARSVLLMHAFDMSGLSFTFKTTRQNFAEHLYAQGWEVWILDSRMSPRTRAAIEPCTVDQLGYIDAPRAVDFIRARIIAEKGWGDPLQIFAFGQCMGAAALAIGLLGGRLSYPIEAGKEYASATGVRPLMPKLAGLVTSQTHPFIVGSRAAQSKTWVPALLRDWAGRTMVPLGVRGPVTSVVESLADRVFAAFPVPEGEHCHGEGERHRIDDDCATCRRIRFLLGGMFLHANLNRATHQELPKLFGAGSVRLFAHGAKFFRYEKLVSEDGHNVYATDEAMGRYLALPLRFLHGELNDLFDRESATRSAEQYQRIHPGWAERYGLPVPGHNGKRVCDVVEGYSHVDVLIGQDAMIATSTAPSVYGRLSDLLQTAWQHRAAAPARGSRPQKCLVVRFPRSGPFLGTVVERNGRHRVGISFVIDDTYAEAPEGAVVLVDSPVAGQPRLLYELKVREMKVAVPARDGQFHVPGSRALTGLRVAYEEIVLPALPPGQELAMSCLSYARTTEDPMRLLGGGIGLPRRPVQPVQGIARIVRPPGTGATPVGPVTRCGVTLQQLEHAIADAQTRVLALRSAAQRPFPGTLSERLRFPRVDHAMRARLAAHVLQAPQAGERVRVAVGCCRYGGFPFEQDRANDGLAGVLQLLGPRTPAADRPRMLFMLGDQIYADRTAGLVDALSPVERFFYRHHEAFTTRTARRLYSSLPTVCLPDDHEFIDGYPLGGPLLRRGPEAARPNRAWPDARELAARCVAQQAIEAYQLGQLPESARRDGFFEITIGDVLFFVLDTRVHRRRLPDGTVRTLQPAARRAFHRWVRGVAPGQLACLVTSSVLLPGLRPGADPANMGPVDTLQVAGLERCWLLKELATHVPGRFVLLSGDYHVSFAGKVCLDGQVVGATIVAPPFYAPLIYANALPEDLLVPEAIPLPRLGTLTVHPLAAAQKGSGYGLLDFEKRGACWRVGLGAQLIDFEQPQGRQSVTWPALDLVPPPAPGLAPPACDQAPPPPATSPPPAATPAYADAPAKGDVPVA